MARSVEDILKEQLGNLLLQLSILQSKVEQLEEVKVKLLKEVKATTKVEE